jgi:hypothetical protein
MPKRRDKSEPPGGSAAGTIFLLIAAGFAAFPDVRNWPFVGLAAMFGILLTFIGSGRIYRPAVTRTGDTIACRYNPWREATFYLSLIGVPLLGCLTIAGASLVDRGSPSFWRIVGILIIAVTPIPVFVLARQSRRSLLRITPSELSVSVPGQQPALTEIPRADVRAISPTTGRLGNGVTAPVTEISYQPANLSPAATQTVLFGPTNTKKTAWLTVEQSDLLGGLHAWKDGDPNDPGLMDRVEAILRGQAAGAPGGVANL